MKEDRHIVSLGLSLLRLIPVSMLRMVGTSHDVRRQDIWLRLRRRLAEDRPRMGVDVRRLACGFASADVR